MVVHKYLVMYGFDPAIPEEAWKGETTEKMGGSGEVLESLDL